MNNPFSVLSQEDDSSEMFDNVEPSEQIEFKNIVPDAKVRLPQQPFHEKVDRSTKKTLFSQLTCSSKYGYFVAAGESGFICGKTESLYDTIHAAGKGNTVSFDNCFQIPVREGGVKFLALSFDERQLIVGVTKGILLIYHVSDVVQKRESAVPVRSVSLDNEILSVHPNPESYPDLVGVCVQNVGCKLVQITTGQIIQTIPYATSASWSPKGKQIVCGNKEGGIRAFDIKGEIKDDIPPPPPAANLEVRTLLWVENHVFFVIYGSTDSLNAEHYSYIIKRKEDIDQRYQLLREVIPIYNSENADNQFYLTVIRDLGDNLKSIIIVANAVSSDFAVVGQNADGIWQTWIFDEGQIPSLPLSESDLEDTFPVGIATDFSASKPLPPFDASENDTPIPPMPMFLFLTNEGHVCAYHVYCDSLAKNAKNYSGMINAEDVFTIQPPTDSPTDFSQAPASSVAQQPVVGAFGAALNNTSSTPSFGSLGGAKIPSFSTMRAAAPGVKPSANSFGSALSQQPVFGLNTFGGTGTGMAQTSSFASLAKTSTQTGSIRPSAFGNITAPTFGSSTTFGSTSNFGNAAASKPAFGSTPSFGNTDTPRSAFGSTPSFGNTDTPKSAFGSTPSFGNTDTPKSAFSSTPSFGTTDKPKSAFGSTPSFGNTDTPKSAFGSTSSFGNATMTQPAFGNTSSFGSATTLKPAFGDNSSFGNAITPKSAFGSTSTWGSTSASQPSFGSSTQLSTPFGTFVSPSLGTEPSTPQFAVESENKGAPEAIVTTPVGEFTGTTADSKYATNNTVRFEKPNTNSQEENKSKEKSNYKLHVEEVATDSENDAYENTDGLSDELSESSEELQPKELQKASNDTQGNSRGIPEAEKRNTDEEAEQKQPKEENKQKLTEEEAKQKPTEEEAKQKQTEEKARQKQAEEEARQKQAEEETKQKRTEEETKQKQAEEEARQKQAEEEARQKQAEEEARQKQAEEEAKQKQAKEEARQEQAEEEAKLKQAEEEGKETACTQQQLDSSKLKALERPVRSEIVPCFAQIPKSDEEQPKSSRAPTAEHEMSKEFENIYFETQDSVEATGKVLLGIQEDIDFHRIGDSQLKQEEYLSNPHYCWKRGDTNSISHILDKLNQSVPESVDEFTVFYNSFSNLCGSVHHLVEEVERLNTIYSKEVNDGEAQLSDDDLEEIAEINATIRYEELLKIAETKTDSFESTFSKCEDLIKELKEKLSLVSVPNHPEKKLTTYTLRRVTRDCTITLRSAQDRIKSLESELQSIRQKSKEEKNEDLSSVHSDEILQSQVHIQSLFSELFNNSHERVPLNSTCA